MPLTMVRRNRLWRLLEPSGKVAKSKHGRPVDGGGHFDRAKAAAQMRAINAPKR